MKKILFYLNIAWAICSPNSLYAHDVEPESGFKIAQKGYTFDVCPSKSENVFLDVCLEDLTDDDSNDSEGKKLSSGNTSAYNTSFIPQNYYDNKFEKTFPVNHFLRHRTPLFIFICVFRI